MKQFFHACVMVGLAAGCTPSDLSGIEDAGTGPALVHDAGGLNNADQDAGAALPDAGDPNACPSVPVEGELVVPTHRGPVQGAMTGSVMSFRGIPYAAPPVDTLRWKAPEEPGCWSEPRDATEYGAMCPQIGTTIVSGDEDCLFLNVWTPSLTSPAASPRPVMFFIHGGGQIMGASNQEGLPGLNLYDGENLATDHDVVVVTVNYRLGPLGFLAHPSLSDENARQVSGNYGILDLIHALKWVKRNIAQFGGNPDNVMVFGESAGALNTCALVASPLAAGLFHAALMQSGECVAPPLTDRERAGQQAAVALGCAAEDDVPACLRSKSAAFVLAQTRVDPDLWKVWDLPSGPAVDGYVLTDSPIKVIEAGQHNKVPFVIGANAHETELFLPPVVNTCLDYYAVVALAFPNISSAVTDTYPCFNYLFARWAVIDLTTDLLFQCPARRTARAMQSHQAQSVWRYRYTHVAAYGGLTPLRSFHASELPYVFRTHTALAYLATTNELDLSNQMMGYWARFARTHNPNGGDAQQWPPYTATEANILTLDTPIELAGGFHDEECDFWDTLAP